MTSSNQGTKERHQGTEEAGNWEREIGVRRLSYQFYAPDTHFPFPVSRFLRPLIPLLCPQFQLRNTFPFFNRCSIRASVFG
jgi:hypothetical protein